MSAGEFIDFGESLANKRQAFQEAAERAAAALEALDKEGAPVTRSAGGLFWNVAWPDAAQPFVLELVNSGRLSAHFRTEGDAKRMTRQVKAFLEEQRTAALNTVARLS